MFCMRYCYRRQYGKNTISQIPPVFFKLCMVKSDHKISVCKSNHHFPYSLIASLAHSMHAQTHVLQYCAHLECSTIDYHIINTLYCSEGIFWADVCNIGTGTRTLRSKWVHCSFRDRHFGLHARPFLCLKWHSPVSPHMMYCYWWPLYVFCRTFQNTLAS